MFAKALIAFAVLPGMVGILIPIALSLSDPWRGAWFFPGALIVALGAIVLIWCVRDFYISGKGTLAPWAPPKALVVVGLYRYTRNPMYGGVLLIVSGIAFLMASPVTAVYCVLIAIGFHLRVILSEEPYLSAQFGEDWSSYRMKVPRWLPRFGGNTMQNS